MKIPIWIYQVHPDHRSFWARLNSSAWVLHINQGPQSYQLVSRSQSLAAAPSSARTLIMRVPLGCLLSLCLFSPSLQEFSQCSGGPRAVLWEAEHRFDKTHNDAAPLSSTEWEVHPDCLWGPCCLWNFWVRENGSVISRMSEKATSPFISLQPQWCRECNNPFVGVGW